MTPATNFDILIIGGGIIGLSVARELSLRGVKKIGVLEKNSICGSESSWAAAGMLAPQSEADCADDFFRFCAESRDSYPQFAEQLFDESGVDVELDRTGTLYLAFNENDAAELEERFAWQTEANLKVEKLTAKEILELEPSISKNILWGLRFPLDWQVENRKIIEALNKQLTGIKLNKFQRTEQEKVQLTSGEFVSREVKSLIFDGRKIVGVETDYDKIYADVVVIASGAWTSLIADKFDLLSGIAVKPVRGQMIAFNDDYSTNYPHGLFRHVIYSRRGYLVPKRNYRILTGATVEDVGFESRTTGAGVNSLLETAFEISPQFQNLSLKNTWSGLRPIAPDGMPILGMFSDIENLYVATAHYRNGILLAPRTAQLMADKIIDNDEHEYLKIFSPRRFQASEKTFVNHSASQ